MSYGAFIVNNVGYHFQMFLKLYFQLVYTIVDYHVFYNHLLIKYPNLSFPLSLTTSLVPSITPVLSYNTRSIQI